MTLLKTILQVPTKPQIGVMTLDASLRENHVRSSIVAENEIEDGSVISDHVRRNPDSVTIDGIISDFPVGLLGIPGVSATELQRKILGSEGLVKGVRKNPEDAWQYLIELQDAAEPFTVITSLQTYDDMIIEELSAPRTSEDGKSLLFTARLKKIKLVFTDTTDAFKVDETVPGAASKKKQGKQSTKETTGASEDKGSVLFQLFN